MKQKTKQQFIGEYLDKNMKGHGLPLSLEYYNLLERKETAALIAYKKYKKKFKSAKKP